MTYSATPWATNGFAAAIRSIPARSVPWARSAPPSSVGTV